MCDSNTCRRHQISIPFLLGPFLASSFRGSFLCRHTLPFVCSLDLSILSKPCCVRLPCGHGYHLSVEGLCCLAALLFLSVCQLSGGRSLRVAALAFPLFAYYDIYLPRSLHLLSRCCFDVLVTSPTVVTPISSLLATTGPWRGFCDRLSFFTWAAKFCCAHIFL
jgi:hypothetical protein